MIPTRTRAVLLGAMLAAAPLLGGCQIPIVIAEMMFPKTKVPPKFELPGGAKTVLVFPDDMLRPVSYPPVKRTLAERISKALKDNKAATWTVPYDDLVDLRHDEPEFNRLAVSTVGKRLGADLVIYVDITDFRLKDAPVGPLWKGRFAAKVRVVDVAKGRLWPDESAGHPVSVAEPTTDNSSETYGETLANKLAERLADDISGLFYTRHVDRHRPKDTEPQFEPE